MSLIRDPFDPTALPFPRLPSQHHVQFYEDDSYLFALAGDFLGDGLTKSEPVVVIATPEHRDGLTAHLRSKGFVFDDRTNTAVTLLDARETLAKFMDGATPNPERFASTIGSVIHERTGGHPRRIRAYGEMVDLLWRDGMPQAALRLEELWNDLSEVHAISLLCAYPIGNFYRESDYSLLGEVCDRHGHVIPVENYTFAAGDDARAREVIMLQQRAAALQTELQHRVELEGALREALDSRRRVERELKDFVENANVAMHWVGPDGTILWANDAELKLLGYSAGEYIGRKITEFHADKEVIEDILSRLASNEELAAYEARLLARDGSIRFVSINSNVLFEEGRFVHTRCFTHDITARKREEQQKATLLEASAVLARSLNADLRMNDFVGLMVSKVADWCAVAVPREEGGWDPLAVAHRDPQQVGLIHDAIRDSSESDPLHQVLVCGQEELCEEPRLLCGAHASSSIVVPMKLNQRVLGVIVLGRVEPSRRIDASDLPFMLDLATRAAAAFENARLYRAAQHANRMKDEFLATLSHELRTPLTAILGWVRMLTQRELDEETTRTALATIERSALTQASLIDDLLDLSKISVGKVGLNCELIDLATIVENAAQAARPAAEAKAISLTLEMPDEKLIVSGDPTRMQQICWNFLSNAIKFTDGGGAITLGVERVPAGARLFVRDGGCGISGQFLPHVFEPFRQADAGSTRVHGGLGLGLAIVKYLAELHGGTASAISAGEGMGSTFSVTFPLALPPS